MIVRAVSLLIVICGGALCAYGSPTEFAYGVMADDKPLTATISDAFLDVAAPQTRVLIVPETGASNELRKAMAAAIGSFCRDEVFEADRQRFAFALIHDPPLAGTDFPPRGTAYVGSEAQSQYLWRAIAMWVPDLVVVVSDGDATVWQRPPAEGGLASALLNSEVAGIGTIGACELSLSSQGNVINEVVDSFGAGDSFPQGSAKPRLLSRVERTPLQIAKQLSQHYGNNLTEVSYIPSLALISQMRIGDLADDNSRLLRVRQIATDYAEGKKAAMGNRVSGGTIAGHLLFTAMARSTGDKRYIKLVRAAADLAFNEDGSMKEAMPLHNEMSDAVFMATPILVQAGLLTGEGRYLEMAIRHLRFMLNLNLRDDGLHQHSPLDPQRTAWGRGNGFPALGLALCLSELPDSSSYYKEMLDAYRNHIAAMLRHQDAMGMWHQVVDRPESYREFTVTCMTTFAIVRGIRMGWIAGEKYLSAVAKAWQGIKYRISTNGELVDVCTGTGKQKSLRDYYHRKAVLGRDDRGGAMAMLVATEIESARREGKLKVR